VIRVPIKGLIVRQSSDVLAVPDLTVAKALRFIWDNFGDGRLAVEDVARAVGVGYRTLHRAFLQHLGRSVGQELRRKRLELAVALLRGTSTPVAEVAAQCGYRSAERLRSTLKQLTGIGPRTYRRRAAAGKAPDIPSLLPTPGQSS